MNVNDPNVPSASSKSSAPAERSTPSIQPGARVEPCEFESLLRRAMEIMNARTRATTNSTT